VVQAGNLNQSIRSGLKVQRHIHLMVWHKAPHGGLLAEVENSVLLPLLDFYINKKTKKFNAFPFEQALNFFVE
jgi:hypothetical protein